MKLGFDDYPEREVTWQADVCVIGAGAGGSATACALAESGLDVVVLEAGSHWKPSQFKASPKWALRNLFDERGVRSAMGNAMIPVTSGRGVGGSTLINSAICFRTPDPVMAEWSERYGCTRMAKAALGPKLDRVWRTIGVTVNPVEVQRNNNLIFKLGADRLGLPGEWMARSAPGCVGCGLCQMGCPTGGKWSVDRTFLAEALRTGRCRVHADCRVQEVTTRGDAVVAVAGQTIDPRTLLPAGSFRVHADRFVFSAGPISTPRLLQSTGLVDDAICGANLHLHPAIGLLGRFEEVIEPWHGVVQGYYVDRWERGYLLQTYTTSPDQTYMVMPSALGMEALEVIRDLAHMAMAGPLVHDEDSHGRVTLSGLQYFVGDGDRRRLLAGMREATEVFFAAGAQAVYPCVVGTRALRSPQEVAAALHDDIPARQLYLYASHPMGTCRMGGDRATSVVNPDGRVWGWRNLYVADASVFPTSLGVNPQVTTMAVGLTVGQVLAES